MLGHIKKHLSVALLFASIFTNLAIAAPEHNPESDDVSLSANPAAINIVTGTGKLGETLFHLKPDSGFRIGGAWMATGDYILSGGNIPNKLSGNNLVILGFNLNTEKADFWPGGLFGLELLQFNGMNSNFFAGSVQGYNTLPGQEPLNRFELYQIFYRQALFNKKLFIRVGKTVPSNDFNNVIRPVPVNDIDLKVPSVSGLIYTPIFVNSSMLGVLPGYYNSAYGVTVNITPVKRFYIDLGAYDGNLARGKQLGIEGPHFNGYYFYIAEIGVDWKLGKNDKPGQFSIGGWDQTGKLNLKSGVSQTGTHGFYAYAAQRIWLRHPNVDKSGMSGFIQYGCNNSRILPMKQYLGLGLTFFSITRPRDSFGFGMATAWLNPNTFQRKNEMMLQGYYQTYLFSSVFLNTALTYIPTPGISINIPQTWAATTELIVLF